MNRRKVQPDELVPVPMTHRDRDLLREHTLAEPEYIERLQARPNGKGLIGQYTLDDLEDLLGYIAAESHHTEDKSIRRRLDALYDRLLKVQRSFDDGNWNDSAI